MSKTNEIATKTEQINLANPSDIMSFATNLKDLIVQNELYTNIKGKNYVNVEGWQIAGAFTGVFPLVEKVEDLSDGTKYKYRAEVTLRDKDNNIVGSGTAICTNKEAGKNSFDEYAVASMAQTRAVGKAFRMKIGWLLKIAGYETTPAEEMDAVREAEVVQKKKLDDMRGPMTDAQRAWLMKYYMEKEGKTEVQAKIKCIDFKNAGMAKAEIERLHAELEGKNA